MSGRQGLIVGNWKMHGNLAANQELLRAIHAGIAAMGGLGAAADRADDGAACAVALAVPAPYLAQVQALVAGSALALAAQDLSQHEAGAHTGEVSASMLRDFGVRYVLVGHSERRQHHGETDAVVAQKAQRALAAGLTPIVCLGETLQERAAGQTEAVVRRQLAAVIQLNGHCISEVVLAYEPVWAIGTGHTASAQQAQAVHAVLRAQLGAASEHAGRIRLLYGGSMTAANAAPLLAQPDIDGGLVGGAALKAPDFLPIIAAARQGCGPALAHQG